MKNTGFTLIEVLIFTSLISFIFITLSYITVNSIQNSKIGTHKILATHYAEELREVLRRYKETDWAQFTTQVGTFCYDASTNPSINLLQFTCLDSSCTIPPCPYTIGNLPDAVFKRYATISYNGIADQAVVAITVEWNDGGKKFSVPLHTIFAQNQ